MALLLLSTLSLCHGFFEENNPGRPGNCPSEKPLESFNIDFFKGIFYQITRSTIGIEGYSECTVIEFDIQNETTVDVIKYVLNIEHVLYYDIYSINFDASGKFTEIHEEGEMIGTIIDSDFETYFVNYYCTSSGENKKDYIEIYAKDPNFDPSPYYYLSNDRGIENKDLSLTIRDSEFCIEPNFRYN